jgi:hypothetical protein
MSGINRITSSIKLGELFQKDNDDKFILFNSLEERGDSKLKYRIPEHQRYPQWKNKKKMKFIDSIFRDYPIGQFIISKGYEIITQNPIKVFEYFDIQDGQTRLSVAQDYYNGGFKNYEGLEFEELEERDKKKFEDYTISLEIIETLDGGSVSDNDIHEIFDRLQEGEPLKDADRFWNWKEYSLVKNSIELINSGIFHKYMGTENFSCRKRDRLPDIASLLSYIIHHPKSLDGKSEIDTLDYINNTYKSHYCNIKKEISDNDLCKVRDFITKYFNILDKAFEISPDTSIKGMYYSLSKSNLSLYLYEYIKYPEKDNFDIWVQFYSDERIYKNFARNNKQIWNNVLGDPSWTQPIYIKARYERVIEFYELKNNNKDLFIQYCLKNEIDYDKELNNDSSCDSE